MAIRDIRVVPDPVQARHTMKLPILRQQYATSCRICSIPIPSMIQDVQAYRPQPIWSRVCVPSPLYLEGKVELPHHKPCIAGRKIWRAIR